MTLYWATVSRLCVGDWDWLSRCCPALRALYSPAAIRETCGGAAACMFGQQKDEHRAWVPNSDLIFSEAETRSEIKMLPEMRT